MKKFALSVLIICLYCFPFVYYSMYKDFNDRSMTGYLVMILITSVLAFIGKRSHNPTALIIGNIASAILSYYFINKMSDNYRWQGYFKPFPPAHLLILVSFLNLIPQWIATKLAIIRSSNKMV